MRLADQWRDIQRRLPENWSDARLSLRVAEPTRLDRAAALLAPLAPGRSGQTIRFFCSRAGAGPGPEAVLRALRRLDAEGIEADLALLAAGEPEVRQPSARQSLASAWDAAVAALPDDWSDVYAEIELRSTDHLERGALLMAPLNPARYGDRATFRFRVARRFGYGASPQMTRRCLERCDREGITGDVRILRALSDTDPVGTQGPVWYVGGRSV